MYIMSLSLCISWIKEDFWYYIIFTYIISFAVSQNGYACSSYCFWMLHLKYNLISSLSENSYNLYFFSQKSTAAKCSFLLTLTASSGIRVPTFADSSQGLKSLLLLTYCYGVSKKIYSVLSSLLNLMCIKKVEIHLPYAYWWRSDLFVFLPVSIICKHDL